MKKLLFQSGMLLLLFVLSSSPLHAATVNCNAPGQELQNKIDSASVGEQLNVNGVCDNGPYTIRRDISLVGPATLSATAGSVLTIISARAEIRNITIIADNASNGLEVRDNGTVTANNIVVSGAPSTGILVGFSSFLQINSSTVNENRIGVNVFNGSGLRMFDTTVEHNTLNGIDVSRTSDGAIFDSRIRHNTKLGVQVVWDGTLQISGTEITNNGVHGLAITLDSFVNFFDPPSTIESNGLFDIRCDGRSGFFAVSTQLSVTMALSKTADCLDGFVAGFGASVF